jgi:hypothetical protein
VAATCAASIASLSARLGSPVSTGTRQGWELKLLGAAPATASTSSSVAFCIRIGPEVPHRFSRTYHAVEHRDGFVGRGRHRGFLRSGERSCEGIIASARYERWPRLRANRRRNSLAASSLIPAKVEIQLSAKE